MANIRFRKNSSYVSGQKIKFLGGTGQISTKNIGGGGSGGGDPGVTGLMTWLKADTGVVYSGPDITTWQDQSGNGRDWTANSAGFIVETNIQNGLPVMTAPQYTNLNFSTPTFLANGDPAEVFVVVKSVDNGQSAGWSQFGSSTSTRYTFFNQIRETFGYSTYDGVTKYDGSAGFSIYNVSVQAGELIMRADYPDGGSEPGLVILRTNNVIASTTWRASTFLLFKTGFTPWWGSIGELLVYDHVLTDPDRTAVYNYLQGRWSVS